MDDQRPASREKADSQERGCGCAPGCCNSGGATRREFLSAVGLGSLAVLGGVDGRVMAGPFQASDFENLVPADKKLDEGWVESLFAAGEPSVYRGAELAHIGMPVGGMFAGQLYLGGDGRLWLWDIFNRVQNSGGGGPHYANPLEPEFPLEQGFAVQVTAGGERRVRTLDHRGWREISFKGQYPIANVSYRDPEEKLAVDLLAFSPFIPVNVEDSSLPATILQFTVTNTGEEPVKVEVAGWLENAVGLYSAQIRGFERVNRIRREGSVLTLECSAREGEEEEEAAERPDVVFADFEDASYKGWKTAGSAFGAGPVTQGEVPSYQGQLGMRGERAVNSHAASPGGDTGSKDEGTGRLTSDPFTIERHFITFLAGGGSHAGKTCVNLVVDGEVVRTATGRNQNQMQPVSWNVRTWEGRQAHIEVVDAETGSWGNIGIDHIVFTDRAGAVPAVPLASEPDFGTLGLVLLDAKGSDFALASLPEGWKAGEPLIFGEGISREAAASVAGATFVGALGRALELAPGQSATATYAIAWHFPNLKLSPEHGLEGRHYATRFGSVSEVAAYLGQNGPRLKEETVLWQKTWYGSTLPQWFLDRTFLNTSILATNTCYRFPSGRFYGWEGVGCCPGTCGHVWGYAHAVARLFPELERDTRQRVDFGLAQQADGSIFFRGEFNDFPAVDGQATTILRALREHQMSTDAKWLQEKWPRIKLAIEWLISKDEDGDGLIRSNQHNTLDADWYGPVAWLSGLYLTALRAGEEMARECEDEEFAGRCRTILEKGRPNLIAQLFDGEYFVNRPDPGHPESINSGSGCEIDQVFGQSWAFQVGLGRILPERETHSALRSLWRYNFAPDVGPYRKANEPGRWYAMPGEAGLLMCTFPRKDWNYDKAKGQGANWAAGYFNECMCGFEYQVAAHMLWEGMLLEGLAITRAIHDRYHPSRRNPWNEIECGDHYARSMASYGVYLAACGFTCDGPAGMIAFDPKIRPEKFACAFTMPAGWGDYSQEREARRLESRLEVRWGQVRLRSVRLATAEGHIGSRALVTLEGAEVPCRLAAEGRQATISFDRPVLLGPGKSLRIEVA